MCSVRCRLTVLAVVGLLLGLAEPAAADNIEQFYWNYFFDDGVCAWGCIISGDSAILDSTTAVTIYTESYTHLPDVMSQNGYSSAVTATLYNGGEFLYPCYGWDGEYGIEGQSVCQIWYSPIELPGEYILTSNHFFDGGIDPFHTTQVVMLAGVPQVTSVSPSTIILESSGQITIQGNYLMDPFASQANFQYSGQLGSGGYLSFYSYNSGTGAVTLNYAIVPGASRGNQTLAFQSRFGTSSPATILVGDHSPAITGVSSPWQAGGTVTVTVNGLYFGVNPSVAVNLANPNDNNCNGPCVGAPVITQHSNTQITFTVTIGANEPGNTAWVSVTSNGYDNNPPRFLGPQPSTAYWGTGPNIPITPLLATVPVILYFGNTVPQNPNQQVYVGQEIVLSAGDIVVPNGLSIVSSTWTIQGTAVAGYTASAANPSLGQVTALPNPITGTGVTFYWTGASNAGGCAQTSCSVTFTYELSNLQVGSATVTFNVGAPTGPPGNPQGGPTVTATPSGVIVRNPPSLDLQLPDIPVLENGGAGAPGMQFLATATLPPANPGLYWWVQLISSDQSCNLNPNYPNGVYCPPNSIPGPAELDTTYPYGYPCPPYCNVWQTFVADDSAKDSPLTYLVLGQGEYMRSFNATMYLTWIPNADNACNAFYGPCTIPAPLGSVSWHWSGDAIDTLNIVQAQNPPPPQGNGNAFSYQLWVPNWQNPSCANPHNSVANPFHAGGPLPQWNATIFRTM